MPQRLSKGAWWGAFLVTLIGIGASLYLTVEHFSILKTGALGGETFCNINPYINCSAVLMSRFAEVGTLPLGGLGLIFYLYLAGALIYSRLEPDAAGRILTLPYFLVVIAFLLSLGLAYISLVRIEALCIFCSSLYLVNLLLLFLVKKVMNMKIGDWFKNFGKISWAKNLGVFAVVFGVGVIFLHSTHAQYSREIPDAKLALYIDAFSKQPAQNIDTNGRPFFGNEQAKIVVAEFSDFECPYCKRAAGTLKPILSQYHDRVKLVFMNYPLDTSCNKNLERALHQHSCAAATAAYCAGRQGKFWEYHDKLFDRQPKFQEASLDNIAEKLKLNMTEFHDCLQGDAAQQRIAEDIAQGTAAGVRGTPTVYVNGRKFQPWMSRKAWKQLIERMSSGS